MQDTWQKNIAISMSGKKTMNNSCFLRMNLSDFLTVDRDSICTFDSLTIFCENA